MSKPSRREIDYLKTIPREGARLTEIARAMNVSAASAYEEIRHLEKKGLIVKRDQTIFITEEGQRVLIRALKAHRVIELLMVRVGVDKDEVCELTKEFDMEVPEDVIDKIHTYLGKPKSCPHGEDIP